MSAAQSTRTAATPFARSVQFVKALATRRAELNYADLYERVALTMNDADVVGGGDFDRLGRLELGILTETGLRPNNVLVDFGCGTARLALHAVPYLVGGHYIGIEISESILRRAERNVASAHPEPPCEVTWILNTETSFPMPNDSVDVICAFSVFTHMEHEDAYRYLVDALRVVRPGGRFVFSCLPLELAYARDVFRESAAVPLPERWGQVRSVATSRDFMDAISELAGWNVKSWYRGDDEVWTLAGSDERGALGQSVCVLERPAR